MAFERAAKNKSTNKPVKTRRAWDDVAAGIRLVGSQKSKVMRPTAHIRFRKEVIEKMFPGSPIPIRVQISLGAKEHLGIVRIRRAPENEPFEALVRRGFNNTEYMIQTVLLPVPAGTEQRTREKALWQIVDKDTIDVILPWAADLARSEDSVPSL